MARPISAIDAWRTRRIFGWIVSMDESLCELRTLMSPAACEVETMIRMSRCRPFPCQRELSSDEVRDSSDRAKCVS